MKKVLKILTLIMLILTIFIITDTYAKYFTRATAVKEQEVAQWVIKLNETDIYSETGQTVTFEMNVENIVTDPNVMPGKIAPSSIWYSDIELNPNGTDVAVRYDIEIDPTQIENGDLDVQLEISIVGGEKQLKRTGKNKYAGIMSLSEVQANKTEQIRFSLVWNENEDKNIQDSEIAATFGQKIQLPIKMTCSQYLGEQIVEYNP